jgi:hypothetical protein
MQSLSLKKVVSSLLILFLDSTESLKPFYKASADSKYSLLVIDEPYLSTNCKVKSLTTQ